MRSNIKNQVLATNIDEVLVMKIEKFQAN